MNKITIVAPAYNEDIHQMAFIDAMLNQTKKDSWQTIVYHNGPYDSCRGYVYYKERLSQDSRFIFKVSETNTGMWGTANRQDIIDTCETEYIMQTSVQDYWLPQAIEVISKALDSSPDLLLWNSINHLVGPCKELDSQLAWSKVDWGNFALRSDIAKKVKIQQEQYCADWLYLQDLLKYGYIDRNNIRKLQLILTCHN